MREKSRTNWLRIGVGLSSELSNVRRPIDKARIAAIVLRALPLFSDRTSAQSSFYFWPAKTWTIRVVVSWRFLYLFKFVTTKTKRKKLRRKKVSEWKNTLNFVWIFISTRDVLWKVSCCCCYSVPYTFFPFRVHLEIEKWYQQINRENLFRTSRTEIFNYFPFFPVNWNAKTPVKFSS